MDNLYVRGKAPAFLQRAKIEIWKAGGHPNMLLAFCKHTLNEDIVDFTVESSYSESFHAHWSDLMGEKLYKWHDDNGLTLLFGMYFKNQVVMIDSPYDNTQFEIPFKPMLATNDVGVDDVKQWTLEDDWDDRDFVVGCHEDVHSAFFCHIGTRDDTSLTETLAKVFE